MDCNVSIAMGGNKQPLENNSPLTTQNKSEVFKERLSQAGTNITQSKDLVELVHTPKETHNKDGVVKSPLRSPQKEGHKMMGGDEADVASRASGDLDSNANVKDELDIIDNSCISQSTINHLGLGKINTSRNSRGRKSSKQLQEEEAVAKKYTNITKNLSSKGGNASLGKQ